MRKTGLFELKAVAAVAAHRSFRAAAIELDTSPSALSHAVSALEARMGVRLFHRTTRSVALSEAGMRFLTRLGPALGEIGQAFEDARSSHESPSGTLRINVSEGAAQQIFTPVMLAFLGRYPQMRLDLLSEERLVDIVADGFDAGIRLIDSVPQDMIAVPVGPVQSMAAVATPAYLAAHGTPHVPTDLSGHECIRLRLPSGKLYRWEFGRHGEEMELDVEGRLTLSSHTLGIEAALAGFGIAYASEWFVREHLASGRLVRVLEDWTPPYDGLALYYPGHRLVPAGLRALVELVRESQHWRRAEMAAS
ncbi:LysR family transcriptional regulator [Ancylobacter sp. MQZ15Z-1]|uniref:LysR family transcriptional regulator n=1 Tax=Ancylobacter mangrovi TaxID=2972472 RepID=A0A9X2PKA1_9HYPH|nr:LysR family transcriptional regulator [Ancylobacter mangrovi]MCS0496802.1 LysR family transcriptional regulator [Ancylobacter mangrovi]